VQVITRKGTFDFRIAGIIADMTLGTAYIPLNVARSILGLEDKTSAVLAVFNNNDHIAIRKTLFNHEMVTRVELKRNMETLVGSYMEEMKKLSYVALGVSIFVGVLFMLSSITMNIQERAGEYATLQTLGYFNREIAETVITEILAEGVIAVFLSIPLTIIFSKYLNIKMSQAWISIEMYLNLSDFLIVIISSLLLLPFAGLPGLTQIFRQDIAVAVRRKGFG
jgi:ABC-type antimicrobial peptide transport system permease subunit